MLIKTHDCVSATRSPDRCHEEEFKCNNSRCIPDLFECDFENDCGDGSDEHANCTVLTKCKKTEMRCANKRCVPLSWQCDGEDDCGDYSDELNCGKLLNPVELAHFQSPFQKATFT